MSLDFWNLFWSTGMPEAWLLSRDGEGAAPGRPEPVDGQGPLAPPPSRMSDAPGGPERLY